MSVCALVAASECNEEHFKTLFDAGFFDEVYAVDAGFVYTKNILKHFLMPVFLKKCMP